MIFCEPRDSHFKARETHKTEGDTTSLLAFRASSLLLRSLLECVCVFALQAGHDMYFFCYQFAHRATLSLNVASGSLVELRESYCMKLGSSRHSVSSCEASSETLQQPIFWHCIAVRTDYPRNLLQQQIAWIVGRDLDPVRLVCQNFKLAGEPFKKCTRLLANTCSIPSITETCAKRHFHVQRFSFCFKPDV